MLVPGGSQRVAGALAGPVRPRAPSVGATSRPREHRLDSPGPVYKLCPLGAHDGARDGRRARMSASGEMIDVGGMPAYVARPDGGGPWPAVLVIQEAVGLHDHIQGVARRARGAGYVGPPPRPLPRRGKGGTGGSDELPKAAQAVRAVPG